MKYECSDRLNAAEVIARNTYRRINETAVDFFRDLGGVDNLPEGFDVSGEGWVELQDQIDAAAKEFNIEKTIELCQSYDRRALAYFERWRKKLEKRNGNSNTTNS